jgi:hypothetical protein
MNQINDSASVVGGVASRRNLSQANRLIPAPFQPTMEGDSGGEISLDLSIPTSDRVSESESEQVVCMLDKSLVLWYIGWMDGWMYTRRDSQRIT